MYAYGFAKTNQAQFVRIHLITRELTNGHNFGAGYIIDDIFAGHGVVFVCAAEVATDRRWLYRSTNQGATFSAVHQLGISQDGSQHNPLVKILAKGLDFGELNGAPAIMFAAYNYSVTTRGSVTDQGYIAISIDNGVTWQRLATFNVGKASVRHFHLCQWDMYRKAWWVGSGDDDDESMIVRWDGVTPWPGDKSPVEMAATPGFTVGYGRQRYRTTGLLFTSDWIYSMTDFPGDNDGGIWRFRGDLSEFHRVDHKVSGSTRYGWMGIQCVDGTLMFIDGCSESTPDDQRRYHIYASKTGHRWHDIGRVHLTGTGTVAIPRALFQAPDGNIWIGGDFTSGQDRQTVICEQYDLFREPIPDNIIPAYFVNFATGNDANDGLTARTPWKTARKSLLASAVTHGARVMLSEGESPETLLSVLNYASHTLPTRDTSARVQISGRGRDVTTLTLADSWYNTSTSVGWYVEFDSLRIKMSDGTKTPIFALGSATVDVKWLLRDVTVGDRIIGFGWGLAANQRVTIDAYRARIECRSDAAQFSVRASDGTINLRSCVIYGGRGYQQLGGKISVKHCHFDYTTTNLELAASATQPMEVKNTSFGSNGTWNMLANNSTTVVLTAADVSGNAFGGRAPSANIPSSPLPLSSGLDINPITLEPYPWSALVGLVAPCGVEWDYYGNPFRARPAIGAVETTQF
jgi:hypothetical protein